jgi:Cys-tRNA(Pro)/Cys-tRNA(Cys) deacylase
MASTETAERLTGYHVGGISPFGLQQQLPAVMVNAGQRGVMLKMTPGDIVKALGCRVTPLVG